MGKVEKVIVLSVLFLIALILVVSLTVDDPLDKSHVVEAGTTPHAPVATVPPAQNGGALDPKASPAVADAPATAGGSAVGLLSMPIDTDGNHPAAGGPNLTDATSPTVPIPNATPAAATGLPAGALLKKLDGLQDSILPDMKLYTWQPNDNYRRIADKFYGDWTKFSVLRRSNEGRTDVQPGEQIFVPVFDSDPAVAATPTPTTAVVPVKGTKIADGKVADGKVAEKTGKKSAPKTAASAPKGTGNKTHVVKNGESLWKIAHAELGDGGRWHEIYDLNKDVLPTEKSLHPGLTLRMP